MPIYLKRNPRPSRARRNMAFPKVVDGISFDSMEELVSYKQMMGGGAPRPSRDPLLAAVGEEAASPPARGRRGRQPRGKKAWGDTGRERPASQKSYRSRDLYTRIAHSCGGLSEICPDVHYSALASAPVVDEGYDQQLIQRGETGQGRYKIGGTKIATQLQSLGLTPDKALTVARAMAADQVLAHGSGRYHQGPAEQEHARALLFSVGGITCPASAARVNLRIARSHHR